MVITKQEQAKIAAGAWLEDAGRFQDTSGKEYDICLEMAAFKMVESQLPLISTAALREGAGIASQEAAFRN